MPAQLSTVGTFVFRVLVYPDWSVFPTCSFPETGVSEVLCFLLCWSNGPYPCTIKIASLFVRVLPCRLGCLSKSEIHFCPYASISDHHTILILKHGVSTHSSSSLLCRWPHIEVSFRDHAVLVLVCLASVDDLSRYFELDSNSLSEIMFLLHCIVHFLSLRSSHVVLSFVALMLRRPRTQILRP